MKTNPLYVFLYHMCINSKPDFMYDLNSSEFLQTDDFLEIEMIKSLKFN